MAPVSFSFSEMRLRAPRQHGLLRDAARVRETHSPVVVRQSPCRPRALPFPRVRWPGGSAGQSFFLAPQSVPILASRAIPKVVCRLARRPCDIRRMTDRRANLQTTLGIAREARIG